MDLGGGALELPPGFRFHPTDEELVMYYLCRKCGGLPIAAPVITEVDLYKFEPWKLPEKAAGAPDAKEWYFFSPRDRKYPNGSRPNRAAGTGYWKATGADKPVVHAGKTAGIKKALVFYHGKPPRGVKTDWIMHEYRLADGGSSAKRRKDGTLRLDDWVLCRLYNKKNEWEKMQQDKADKAVSQSQSVSWGETRTPESEIDNDSFPELEDSMPTLQGILGTTDSILPKEEVQELDSDWLMGMNLEDLQLPWDDSYASFLSPMAAMKMEQDLSPFF